MNRNLCEHVTGFLRVGGSVEGHLLHLRKFSAREWEGSLNWLHLSGIALIFWDRLQKLGAEGVLPNQVGARLAANLADHGTRVAAMMEEFDFLNRQFERAGVDCAVWKGFALIPDYCPDACLRPSYDYDYLISEGASDGAQKVLQAAGYARKADPDRPNDLTFTPPQLASGVSIRPGDLYAATLPRKVELHLDPWDEKACPIPLKTPARPLARKVRRNWQGMSFYSLGEPDAFVFQALHTFPHMLDSWCRLGWFLETAYFMESRSADLLFWQRLAAQLRDNAPLAEVVALVISLAARLFHAEIPAPIKGQILGWMRGPVALWAEHYGLSSALGNFTENKNALFLYREFVPDESAWREVRRRRLLPLHRPNRVVGTATPAASAPLPESLRQGWYVVQRLIHHVLSGAGYAWESVQWRGLRRVSAMRTASSH